MSVIDSVGKGGARGGIENSTSWRVLIGRMVCLTADSIRENADAQTRHCKIFTGGRFA